MSQKPPSKMTTFGQIIGYKTNKRRNIRKILFPLFHWLSNTMYKQKIIQNIHYFLQNMSFAKHTHVVHVSGEWPMYK